MVHPHPPHTSCAAHCMPPVLPCASCAGGSALPSLHCACMTLTSVRAAWCSTWRSWASSLSTTSECGLLHSWVWHSPRRKGMGVCLPADAGRAAIHCVHLSFQTWVETLTLCRHSCRASESVSQHTCPAHRRPPSCAVFSCRPETRTFTKSRLQDSALSLTCW